MRTFNLGLIYAVPNAANPTPVPIASLKGIKVAVKQAKKGFRGNMRDIVDVGDGARDWPIEVQHADFRSSVYQMVASGVLSTPGILPALNEQQTIAAGAVTPTNSATFREDAGVYDLTANKWLKVVAATPAVGQYVPGATYTFNVGDNGHVVLLFYSFNQTGALGQKTTISNSVQSQSTPFKMRVYNPWTVAGSSRLIGRDYYSVHFEELDEDWKVEDFGTASLKGFASQDMIGGTLKVCDYWDSELG